MYSNNNKTSSRVQQSDYIVSDQTFEAIIDDETFKKAQDKLKTKKFGNSLIGKQPKHLLSGILKCPDCNNAMVTSVTQWTNKNGEKKEKRYYVCKHYQVSGSNGSCRKNSVPAEVVEQEVIEFTKQLLVDKEFAKEIKDSIGNSLELKEIEAEITSIRRKLKNTEKKIRDIEKNLDNLNVEDKYHERRKASLNERLDKSFGDQESLEKELIEQMAVKEVVKQDKITVDSIYQILKNFYIMFFKLGREEQRLLMESLIDEVHLYTQEEREQMANVKYVKDIQYSFPISEKVLKKMRDNEHTVETVVKLIKKYNKFLRLFLQ